MSIEVMTKVWKTSLPTGEKMVLLVLADHANDDGSDSWPGIATIARKASMSERTVQRHLGALQDAGLITITRQGGGNKKTRDDRRPNRYDIDLKAVYGVTICHSDKQDGVTNEPVRGDNRDVTGCHLGRHGVTAVSPYPSLEPSLLEPPLLEPPENKHAREATTPSSALALVEIVADDDFSHFWSKYPRRTQKETAIKRWANMPRRDRLAALEALPTHIQRWQMNNTEEQFIPHPATWLHQKRWQDEIRLTPSTPQLDKSQQVLKRAMERALAEEAQR
jgi:DNA-binding transcriptional ArsR family regulator